MKQMRRVGTGQHSGVQLVKLHQLDDVVQASLAAVQHRDRRLPGVLYLWKGENGQLRSVGDQQGANEMAGSTPD